MVWTSLWLLTDLIGEFTYLHAYLTFAFWLYRQVPHEDDNVLLLWNQAGQPGIIVLFCPCRVSVTVSHHLRLGLHFALKPKLLVLYVLWTGWFTFVLCSLLILEQLVVWPPYIYVKSFVSRSWNCIECVCSTLFFLMKVVNFFRLNWPAFAFNRIFGIGIV